MTTEQKASGRHSQNNQCYYSLVRSNSSKVGLRITFRIFLGWKRLVVKYER